MAIRKTQELYVMACELLKGQKNCTTSKLKKLTHPPAKIMHAHASLGVDQIREEGVEISCRIWLNRKENASSLCRN
jgi:hypothetical protein